MSRAQLLLLSVLVDLLTDSSLGQHVPGEVARIVSEAISQGQAPGAVVHLSLGGKPPILHAEGDLAQIPRRVRMRPDAVFDLASLTKVVATTLCILRLFDEGRLELSDPVVKYLPEFAANGKETITIEMLLQHHGGLIADNPLEDFKEGVEAARRKTLATTPIAPPGERFLYSDVGFMVLGWVVEVITVRTLDESTDTLVLQPLALRDTRFFRTGEDLPEGLAPRLVPTESEKPGRPPFLGVVHDPRARALGGVAGHAGLFGTAADLGKVAAMLLDDGRLPDGSVFLRQKTVAAMLSPGHTKEGERRGLGVDISTKYSSPKGSLFGPRSYGHTGFTGTSFWIDPDTQTSIVLLTSRLHPSAGGDVSHLRARLADTVASLVMKQALPLRTGLDRVANGYWPPALRGARIGIISNHTGRTRDGKHIVEVLAARKDVKVLRLFSPEHGFEGNFDAQVGDSVDPTTGLPILSLYGATRRPTDAMLHGLDALVFDIQDIGTRFYTYISTMVYALEEAEKRGLAFIVLDRPNPIGGLQVEGPVADSGALDFVGCLPIPIRHGMTVGEIARLATLDSPQATRLHVITCDGWRRGDLFESSGIPWINPSPNMRSLAAAILYPGIGLFETTNVSVGRGTETPFEVLGAPWIDAPALASHLKKRRLYGIKIEPTSFTPDASTFRGQLCHGLRFEITDKDKLEPLRVGLEVATAFKTLFTKAWEDERYLVLLKSRAVFEGLRRGADIEELLDMGGEARSIFRKRRSASLIYLP